MRLLLLISILISTICAKNFDIDYKDYNYKSFAESRYAKIRFDIDSIDYHLLSMALFYETNRHRVLNGLPIFKHLDILDKSAFGHSRDMVEYNFFSHTSVISEKRSLSMRLREVGLNSCCWAENIAISFGIEYKSGRAVYSPMQNGGYFSYQYRGKPIKNHTYLGVAVEVLKQWMNSAGHKRNILNPSFEYLGSGGYLFLKKSFHNMLQIKFTQNFSGRLN